MATVAEKKQRERKRSALARSYYQEDVFQRAFNSPARSAIVTTMLSKVLLSQKYFSWKWLFSFGQENAEGIKMEDNIIIKAFYRR